MDMDMDTDLGTEKDDVSFRHGCVLSETRGKTGGCSSQVGRTVYCCREKG